MTDDRNNTWQIPIVTSNNAATEVHGKHHASTCTACGATIPHLGRRDLLTVLRDVEGLLAPRQRQPNGEQLLDVDQRARQAWEAIRKALRVAQGLCECEGSL